LVVTAAVPNLSNPDFDEPRDHPGFVCRRARIGRQAGAAKLGASLWEIPPGQAAYPYHYHLGEEELLFVLSGTLALRTPTGWSELAEGDVVSFPTGEEGAHQVVNRGSEPVRLLAISTGGAPDLVVYPESGKVGAFERLPEGGGMHALFKQESAVDYWEGEDPPPPA
jgi:uncharacterized cupin superfamily protein